MGKHIHRGNKYTWRGRWKIKKDIHVIHIIHQKQTSDTVGGEVMGADFQVIIIII